MTAPHCKEGPASCYECAMSAPYCGRRDEYGPCDHPECLASAGAVVVAKRWRAGVAGVVADRHGIGFASLVWQAPDGNRFRTRSDVRRCAKCGKVAIVALCPELARTQPDATTHVCLPALGGCNLGYSSLPDRGAR